MNAKPSPTKNASERLPDPVVPEFGDRGKWVHMAKGNGARGFIVSILFLALLAGCARHYMPDVESDPYGFFSGIWHGFIFLYSLIGTIVFDRVYIIGQPNTGFLYYVGFGVGVLLFLKASSKGRAAHLEYLQARDAKRILNPLDKL